MKAIMIDIATCGADCYGDVNNPIDFNARIYDDNLSEIKEVQIKIKPRETVTYATLAETGYDLNKINDGEDLVASLEKIYQILAKCKASGICLIGYNHISYDLKILNDNFVKYLKKTPIEFANDKIIDIMRLAELAIDFKKIGSYSMEAVHYALFEDYEKLLAHRAERRGNICCSDNEFAWQILTKLVSDLNLTTLIDVITFINQDRIVDVISFGKYKGASVSDLTKIDHNYLCWICKNKDLSFKHPALVKSIKEALKSAD